LMWLDFQALGTTKLAAAKKRLGAAHNLFARLSSVLGASRKLVDDRNFHHRAQGRFGSFGLRFDCFLGRPGAVTGSKRGRTREHDRLSFWMDRMATK